MNDVTRTYLIMKSFTINWASSSSSSRWVSSLNHKIGNNSVENQSIVISSTTQFCKIPARVRRMIPIQFDGDGPHGRFHVDEWRLPIFWRNPGHLEIKQFLNFFYLEFISGENTMLSSEIHEQVRTVRGYLRETGRILLPKCNLEERWETFENSL